MSAGSDLVTGILGSFETFRVDLTDLPLDVSLTDALVEFVSSLLVVSLVLEVVWVCEAEFPTADDLLPPFLLYTH